MITDSITIVSGLPRSGTSMMMQMLQAGGIPILTDNVRQADDDNPRGYYEFEPVKRTKQDPSWLNAANGKAVKMVYLLLRDLPGCRCPGAARIQPSSGRCGLPGLCRRGHAGSADWTG